MHPSTGAAERSSAAACALCGEPFASPAQARALGVPPVVVLVCADIGACTRRYLARPATNQAAVPERDREMAPQAGGKRVPQPSRRWLET